LKKIFFIMHSELSDDNTVSFSQIPDSPTSPSPPPTITDSPTSPSIIADPPSSPQTTNPSPSTNDNDYFEPTQAMVSDQEEEGEKIVGKDETGKQGNTKKRMRSRSPIYVLKRTFAYGTPRKERK
jgi:hypothetical protein